MPSVNAEKSSDKIACCSPRDAYPEMRLALRRTEIQIDVNFFISNNMIFMIRECFTFIGGFAGRLYL